MLKYACLSASFAEILSFGSNVSILISRSIAPASTSSALAGVTNSPKSTFLKPGIWLAHAHVWRQLNAILEVELEVLVRAEHLHYLIQLLVVVFADEKGIAAEELLISQ